MSGDDPAQPAAGPADVPDLPEGLTIAIAPDGTVQIHAQCQPGERPEDCEAKVRFLIEALGVPEEGVETTIDPVPPG